MVDRYETEITLSALIGEVRAVTDDMDRLLEEINRRGYDCTTAFVIKCVRLQRAALIAAMQTARTGLSVAVQTE